jgi:CRISPR type IV-associated protein Csf2
MDYQYEGIVRALSSISHIGETLGVSAKLRREKLVTPHGIEEVPVISGNSVRGTLRDAGMVYMCRKLGYGINEETGEVLGLSLPAFHFLFSGGALKKVGDRALDVDAARELRSLIPLVSIFGGAMTNQIMEGKLIVGKLYPICQETAHLLGERFVSNGELPSVWELLQEEAYTRRDDEKVERLRQLIAPEVRALLEAEAASKREKARTGNELDREVGQHQQMRYYVETFAAGTQFYWSLGLYDVTDLEWEAFLSCLVEFAKRPYIGGMSRIGMGKVQVHFDKWVEIDPRISVQGREVAMPAGAAYHQHLSERGERIRSLLDALQ